MPEALVKKRLFLGYNGTMAVGILPVATFCSGHTYFVQKMPQVAAAQCGAHFGAQFGAQFGAHFGAMP